MHLEFCCFDLFHLGLFDLAVEGLANPSESMSAIALPVFMRSMAHDVLPHVQWLPELRESLCGASPGRVEVVCQFPVARG